MTDEQKRAWAENAQETIDSIQEVDPSKISKEQFLLMGASLAVLNAMDNEDGGEIDISAEEQQKPFKTIYDELPERISALFVELANAFIVYGRTKSEYMLSVTDTNASVMTDNLKDILESLFNLIKVLWQGANIPEEKEFIRAFLKSYFDRYSNKSM